MSIKLKKIYRCAIPLFLLAHFPLATAFAALPPEQLNQIIQEKARQLQEIQNQLQETQKNLSETEHKSQSLKQELGAIKGNIKQLDLGIKSNEIKIQKLSLEVDALQYDIDGTERAIAVKRSALTTIVQELQVLDDEDPLILFLRTKTLAEGVSEQAHLVEINTNLAGDVAALQKLNNELNNTLGATVEKKEGIENERRALRTKKTLVEDQKKERQQLLGETKNQERLYQKTIEDLAKKQGEIASEIEAIESELRLKINRNALPVARKGVLGWPVSGSERLTQGYGATPFALRGGYRGKWHNGVDIGGPYGTAILAAEEGVILNTGNQDLFCRRGAYGKYVVLRHANNLTTLYAHLSDSTAQPGMRVKRGDVIGYLGNTGYSRGAHLHFTVYDANTFSMRPSRSCGLMPSGGDLDPQQYL